MIDNADVRLLLDYIRSHWQNTVRHETEDSGTLLGLPYPYTVPCQHEPTMQNNFYWDTYFTNLGLLRQGFIDLAKSNVDNLLFEVEKYGFVPNGNSTFFLTRSQAPFLSLMMKDIYQTFRDNDWLGSAFATWKKEYDFWVQKRLTPIGLNRYFHHATREQLLEFYADELKHRPKLAADSEHAQLALSAHLLAEAESGWDFTPRFEQRCADFAPVDLNSLLYLNEVNAAYFCEILADPEKEVWLERAQCRLKLIHDCCWNDHNGLFYDYDFVHQQQSSVASLATFVALWARLASDHQARAIVNNLPRFEFDYGVSACEPTRQRLTYQWDYPNGWPPLVYLVINGLDNYGFCREARRIAEKYLRVVIKNFQETGELWEKYNVVDGSIQVKNEYAMPAMMGWTAGVFVFCADFLGDQGIG
jgi:alpha,alpha-trehalase